MSHSLTQLQQDFLTIIMSRGSAAPVTGKELASILDMKPRKSGKEGADVRQVINSLRTKGYPICAGGFGYFWPKDVDELDAYIAGFQGRIDDQQTACDGMRKGRDKIGPARAKDIIPQKLVAIHYNGSAYHMAESAVDEYIKTHPGAERL